MELPGFLTDPAFWRYASIPLVAALVGWFTNWIAIQLTFYPVRFIGIPPWLGWQGIIPRKAEKMASISVDSTLARLSSMSDVLEQVEPEVITRHVVRSIEPWVEWYTKDVLFELYPRLWKLIPEPVKQRIYQQVKDNLNRVVDALMEDMRADIEELFDLKQMVIDKLAQDRRLLNRIFLECGEKEFRFIINSGLLFGFLFGLIQMAVWAVYPASWILPAFGTLVGVATNWIALTIIFRPVNPIRVGPWTVQGLFLKRQHEAAAAWCRIVTEEVITIENIVDAMLNGPRSANVRQLVSRHVLTLVDEAAGSAQLAFEVAVGERKLEAMRRAVQSRAIAVSRGAFTDRAFNAERQKIVEQMLYDRMITMSPGEFQDMLRPAFQEDEAKLVAAGGVLGLLAGAAQLVFVFAQYTL